MVNSNTIMFLQEAGPSSEPEERDDEEERQRWLGKRRSQPAKQGLSPEMLQELEEDEQIEREEQEARRRMADELERQEELKRSSMAAVLHYMRCQMFLALVLLHPLVLVMLLS